MADRPITTLFMLTSVDGKISTGSCDSLDVDKDFPKLDGVKQGLSQYYEIEQTMDLWYLNSGRVMAKVGANEKPLPAKRSIISFVLLDNSHLDKHGIEYFCAYLKEFVLVTSNPDHPGFGIKSDNFHILYCEKLDLKTMLHDLAIQFGCQRITVQSGSTINAALLKQHLFDYIDIVVAPVLIGGTDTSSLIGGPSLTSPDQLSELGVLKLIKAEELKDSYLRLRYEVVNHNPD